jgi:hypothetical protein
MRVTPLMVLLAVFAGCPAIAGEAPVAAPAVGQQKYSATDIKTVPADELQLGYQRHAALAQYYRWFQLAENRDSTVENALDILDANVALKSSQGEDIGHSAFRARAAKIPKSWHHAHYVNDAAIKFNADGTMALIAHVTYLNQGILPNGATRSANLTYKTALRPTDTVLPKFTRIEIVQNGVTSAPSLVSQYGANRARSLVYYYLALIDNPKRNAEPFREILADNFALKFSVGKLDTFEKFKSWYDRSTAPVKVSSHTLNSMTYDEVAADTFKVVADFDWQGILADGRVMVGRTLNTWIFTNNPKERFARIKSADVKMLVPFQPKP